MKKNLIAAVALLLLPLASAQAGTWTGWITDEHCAAKGANADHKACAEKCLNGGAALVFYNSADEKIYQLDKQDVAKEHIGHQVKVTGEVDGSKIKVESIAKAEAAHGH